jgi:hypothetical protein
MERERRIKVARRGTVYPCPLNLKEYQINIDTEKQLRELEFEAQEINTKSFLSLLSNLKYLQF